VSEYQYTVLFEPAAEGGSIAACPALPGLVAVWNTLDEARAMAQDAIRASIAAAGHEDRTRSL
jgi:predicted RNase H-like HicB family nuclease